MTDLKKKFFHVTIKMLDGPNINSSIYRTEKGVIKLFPIIENFITALDFKEITWTIGLASVKVVRI